MTGPFILSNELLLRSSNYTIQKFTCKGAEHCLVVS